MLVMGDGVQLAADWMGDVEHDNRLACLNINVYLMDKYIGSIALLSGW